MKKENEHYLIILLERLQSICYHDDARSEHMNFSIRIDLYLSLSQTKWMLIYSERMRRISFSRDLSLVFFFWLHECVFDVFKIRNGSYVIKITIFSFDISCLLFLLDRERLYAVDSSLLLNSKLASCAPISNEIIRHPIKPRAMTQIPISNENLDDGIYLEGSTDGDITIVQQRKIFMMWMFVE